ncbi:MAG: TRAP transporter large permease, partial [Hyphomonadaceae bacterium]|nr:TRAP transporter large permease [Hyphomonadaceae bacterium]
MEIALLFGVFAVLLVLGVPIAFALVTATVATVAYLGLPPIVVAQQVSAG